MALTSVIAGVLSIVLICHSMARSEILGYISLTAYTANNPQAENNPLGMQHPTATGVHPVSTRTFSIVSGVYRSIYKPNSS